MHGFFYHFEEISQSLVQQPISWIDFLVPAFSLCFLQSVCSKKEEPDMLACCPSPRRRGRRWELQCFNTERLEVGVCGDDVPVAAFTNDLKHKDLVYLSPLEDFDDIMYRAKDHIEVEEAL